MRIAFLGTPEPAVPALEAFLNAPDVDVAAVITNPDRPSGRGHRLSPPPVKVAAGRVGLEVWQPMRASDMLADLARLGVDACAVVAYGALLPPEVLDAGGRGFVNLHFSLLPRWRGAAPVQHTILAGDRQTGVTCFVLEVGMDTGPVLAVQATPVGEDETAGMLTARLARMGAPLLVGALRGLVEGTIVPRPQDHARATYAPKVTPADATLDWSQPAEALARAVRAFNPVPGAHTTLSGQRLKIHTAKPLDEAPGGPGHAGGHPAPGTVLAVDPSLIVACGRGALELVEVQPAGKPRMPATAFARGHAIAGAVLGHGG